MYSYPKSDQNYSKCIQPTFLKIEDLLKDTRLKSCNQEQLKIIIDSQYIDGNNQNTSYLDKQQHESDRNQ